MSLAPGLISLGYSPRWQALLADCGLENAYPARVVRADRGSCVIASSDGVYRAKPSTSLTKNASGPIDLPAVGDWVVVRRPEGVDVPLIEMVLPRQSAITRGDPGSASVAQVLAANVDIAFLVHPIDAEPNLRRIERELSLVWDSGAVPAVILTKADRSEAPEDALSAVQRIAFGCDVFITSAVAGLGLEALSRCFADQKTAVLLGPSGAGKSTLANTLLGEVRQETGEVRTSDHRGRHTTVVRELIQLRTGGILIDTPGLRALALTGSTEGIASAFPEIEQQALSCRFRDCSHRDEPGCAVRAAVEAGSLSADRVESYHKLLREAHVAAARTDARLRSEDARKKKAIGKAVKDFYKHSDKRGPVQPGRD